ncbi:MLO-like protein 6 isoform X1 [Malus sylvestris]|uniref:MLO-like protein 6 isoform X1 n=2 Tax=Malus sylvestris TaxID=3752 RepID=UPI0021ACFD6D|nr:MLO-like protein 6 isoform X1 [Malus sylvestris]
MAGGKEGRSLEQTPTWAVAVVCFVLVLISILIEYFIHLIAKWLTKRNKKALYEALEKIKAELMLLGFLSLLLTVGQGPISNICISKAVGATWHPCSKKHEVKSDKGEDNSSDSDNNAHRRLLSALDSNGGGRRVLAAGGYDKCAAKNKVPFVSFYGVHQLHILIFVLAVFHVLYCITTLVLGRAKMRRWKIWELETQTADYQFSHGLLPSVFTHPERFRFARDTSFGRRHLSFWSRSPISLWIVCFFRQFFRSVPKVDYLTLRHGFIAAHLAPQSQTKFDFQKYINRSLEEDFKVVVGISPTLWLFSVLFLMSNTHGSRSYLWLPFVPLVMILMVGTKLQVIITKMGLKLSERGEVVKGTPLVEPGDHLFWFNNPRLLLYIIHFVLFQNAFALAFFAWTWYEFGLKSCFHEKLEDVVLRISMGVVIQILCSYVTLPLYALVTQMGSTMKPVIFNDRVATALKKWHIAAKKHIKHNKNASPVGAPGTPSHAMSPVHLLRNYQSEQDTESFRTLPRMSYFDNEGSFSPFHHQDDLTWSQQGTNLQGQEEEISAHGRNSESNALGGYGSIIQHEIQVQSAKLTFEKSDRS